MRENKQITYIKPQIYEKWKKRSFQKDISKREISACTFPKAFWKRDRNPMKIHLVKKEFYTV